MTEQVEKIMREVDIHFYANRFVASVVLDPTIAVVAASSGLWPLEACERLENKLMLWAKKAKQAAAVGETEFDRTVINWFRKCQ